MRARYIITTLAVAAGLTGAALPLHSVGADDPAPAAQTCEPGQATIGGCLQSVGSESGLGNVQSNEATGVATYVGAIIQAALALVGVIFLAQMVYAGYLWMTARGESDQVDKAKETIQRSIIGLVIVLAAWAITAFVVSKLVGASGLEIS